MDIFQQFVNDLAVQQDFFWFLASFVWLGMVVRVAQLRRTSVHQAPRWLLAMSITMAVYASTSLAVMIVPHAFNSASLQDDILLVLPLAVLVAACNWGVWQRRGRLLTGAAIVLLISFRYFAPDWAVHRGVDAITRIPYTYNFAPEWSANLLALLGCLGGWRMWRVQSEGPRLGLRRLGVLATILLPIISPVGAVSFWIRETQMWHRLPRLGLPSAVVLTVAGGVWLWLYLAPQRIDGALEKRATEELRRFGAALVCWLIIGFGMTAVSGRLARISFEQGLLAQARMGATLIDTRLVAACLVPEFKISAPIASNMSDGSRSLYAIAPFLTTSRVAALRSALGVVHRTVPSALYAHLVTMRSGYVITFLFDDDFMRRNRFVPIHRQVADTDLIDWANRESKVGPVFNWGQRISARVPLLGPGRQMLGWLAVDVPIDVWSAAQFQTRFQALLFIGAGVGLGAMMFGLRMRERERSSAVQMAAAAREAERMQTVFLAKVSHELRTPVQNILGYTQLLRPAAGDRAVREQIDAVQAQGQLMIRLVNDLIDLSAAQSGSFRLRQKRCRLLPVIKESVEAMRPRAAAKGLSLEVDLSCPEAEIVWCDPERLRQIVTNLVSNALKFTDTGWVRVSFAPIAAVGSRLTYQLVVSDSGPGISAPDQANLFRPFERLSAGGETEGSGLGLALTRMICAAMQGTLEVVSDGCTGSAFIAKFESEMAGGLALPDAEISVGHRLALKKRILVAEDNKLVRHLFCTWLGQAGATVVEATDGWDAYQKMQVQRPDALIVDLSMPGLGGIALTRKLRSEGWGAGQLRIVGVSAHAGIAERDEATNAGMDAFLLKPIEAKELLSALAGLQGTEAADEAREGWSELLTDLHRTFAQEAPGQLQQLETAVILNNFVQVAKIAHDFGNAAFALQAAELGRLSGELERAARRDSPRLGDLPQQVAAAVSVVLEKSLASARPVAQVEP